MQSSINPLRLRQKQPRLKLNPEEYTLLRTRILERDGWRCQECGSMEGLEIHHMKARSRLGDDVMDNLITLCVECHVRRRGVNRRIFSATKTFCGALTNMLHDTGISYGCLSGPAMESLLEERDAILNH